jgi:hypothetical protein
MAYRLAHKSYAKLNLERQNTLGTYGLSINIILKKREEEAKEFLNDVKDRSNYSDIIEWISHYRFINGKPWSFKSLGIKMELGKYDVVPSQFSRHYLNQYLRSQAPTKSIIKARQTEMSENHLNELIFVCLSHGYRRVHHLFPTDVMGDNFSSEKISPAIKESPRINRQLDSANIRRFKFLNGSQYSISGAIGKAGGRSGSRDVIAYDEYDFMPESIVGVFRAMLSHSDMQWERFFSTGTVPGVGIDKKVSEGSENEWHFKCAKCKTEQTFDFYENIINGFEANSFEQISPSYEKKLDLVYIGCRKCKTPIDRNSNYYIKNSFWVPKKKELINIHDSYRMVAPIVPWNTGKSLLRKSHKLSSYPWQFWNEDWGTAFIKGNSRLSQGDILACQGDYKLQTAFTAQMSNRSIGIDWGEKQSWVVVKVAYFGKNRFNAIVYLEEINENVILRAGLSPKDGLAHVKRVAQIIRHFDIDIIVNDANGIGIDRNKTLMQYFPNKVYGAFFDTSESGKQLRGSASKLIVPNWNEDQKRVTFSKLSRVKEIQNQFRQEKVLIPIATGDYNETIRKFIDHHCNLGIQPRLNVEANREYEIVVKFGDDHFFDSNMYADVGLEKLVGVGFRNNTGGLII